MPSDLLIDELLEKLLESNLSAEEVCVDHPELLAEVQARLRQIQAVNSQLNWLFAQEETHTAPNLPDHAAILLAKPGEFPVIRDHEIEAELGRGGMGIVYRARHVKLNRVVAVKMLIAGLHASPRQHLRFLQEAESIAALKHPNIIQIYDFGEAGRQPYFAMEYVEGGSLAAKLAGAVQPVRESAKMVATLAQAVAAAHESGIIHRDLKPANILLDVNQSLKIGDFGLARRIESDGGLTQTGMIMGTPNYMAPEQMAGKPELIGRGVDIFALGAMLYEMLVGRPPFLGKSFSDTERRLLQDEPIAPSRENPKVPRDLETICLKCLEKNPEHRYATAGELAADLDRFLRHEPILARPVSRVERGWRWIRRNPLPTLLAVTAVILIGLIVANSLRERALTLAGQAEKMRLTERYESGLQLVQEERFAEAKAILGKLGDGGHQDLRRRVDQTLADLKLVEELDDISVRRAIVTCGIDDSRELRKVAALSYAALFAQSGLGTARGDLQTVVQRIDRSDIKGTLVAALDDWAVCEPDETRRDWLLNATQRADPARDGWPDQARDPATWHDRAHLRQLASTASSGRPSVYLLRALGDRLGDVQLDPIPFFQQVQLEHPDSFLANFALANALRTIDPAESIRFYQAALAIRPNSVPAGNNLAIALADSDRLEEAVPIFQRMLTIDPQSARVHYNFGIALLTAKRSTEAFAEFEQATKLEPGFTAGYGTLGRALFDNERYSEARPVLQKYLDGLSSDDPERPSAAEMLRRCQ